MLSAGVLAVVLTLLSQPAPDVRRDGAFGFPQKEGAVLCDTPALRLSAWNDREHLYVQAVLFTDGDDSLGARLATGRRCSWTWTPTAPRPARWTAITP